MARPSTIKTDIDAMIENVTFSAIPLARRNEIQHEVQQEYVARLNVVKAQVETLTTQQRAQFHQTLATLLAETSFTRSTDERK